MFRRSSSLVVAVAAVFLAASCSGGQQAQPPSAAPSAAAGGAVSNLDGVKSATIQIEAEGSFVHPQVGEVLNAAGRGSGFIIDPSGIAVTNNHVVTGAALLKVWVGGSKEPRNARLLGVSECSDLAVIDIDGDGFPYLQWYQGQVNAGLDIYVAGFPLGDPEYTLTKGIVAKEKANGEWNFASVDAAIQHDASTNPGNSGGPVVNAQGQVVAIHYAGLKSVGQQFAIGRDEALKVVDQLRAGKDVTSIGVNGQAVRSQDGSISGVWVASVKSGSPAANAGLKGGDILTKLEGLVLGKDGTMSDYCDVLRTHNSGDKLSVEVLRFRTKEVLEGELNGRQLVQSFSFAQQEQQNTENNTEQYSGYVQVADNTKAISMEVPREWKDVSAAFWKYQEKRIGVSVAAAPDLDKFFKSWTAPGVFFGASRDMRTLGSVDKLLDSNDFSKDCKHQGRKNYSDATYAGKYDHWAQCEGGKTDLYVLAAQPKSSRDYMILVQIQVVSDADLAALDHIVETFQVRGRLP